MSPRRRCALTAPFHPYLSLHPRKGGCEAIGGVFSVALSVGSPRLAVSKHPALWCSDFPPPAPSSGTVVQGQPRAATADRRRPPDPLHADLMVAEWRDGHKGDNEELRRDNGSWIASVLRRPEDPCGLTNGGFRIMIGAGWFHWSLGGSGSWRFLPPRNENLPA